MPMRRWDIVFLREEGRVDPTGHPAVVLTGDGAMADEKKRRFNILLGTRQPPAAATADHHELLNGADGLDHLTQVDCSLVYVVRKECVLRSAGRVSVPRRNEIARRVRAHLGLG